MKKIIMKANHIEINHVRNNTLKLQLHIFDFAANAYVRYEK